MLFHMYLQPTSCTLFLPESQNSLKTEAQLGNTVICKVCYSISLELLEKLFFLFVLWLQSHLCIYHSEHRCKKPKNHSKTFHLLFMPSTCRQAAAWSRCRHCTITSFLKPGTELRLSIWQTSIQQLLVPVLKEIPHGHLKNLPLHPQNSILNTSKIFWGLQKGILFLGQRTACICNSNLPPRSMWDRLLESAHLALQTARGELGSRTLRPH